VAGAFLLGQGQGRERDALAERLPEPPSSGNPERMRLPGRGQSITRTLPNGLPVRVEHHRDGSWWLIIPNIASYPLIADPMSVPKRRMVWRDGAYHLQSGMRRPVRFYILDATGKRVRNLYAFTNPDGSFRVGSRHELKMNYATDFMSPEQRTKHRLDKVRAEHPTRADAIFDWKNDIATLLRQRPHGMRRKDWLETIIRARWGIVHKGDGEKIEFEITRTIQQHIWPSKESRGILAAINQYIWPAVRVKKSRGQPKGKLPAHFDRTLGEVNRRRQQAKRRQEELEIEPPLPMWTRGDDY
jgi:hypothetical protein